MSQWSYMTKIRKFKLSNKSHLICLTQSSEVMLGNKFMTSKDSNIRLSGIIPDPIFWHNCTLFFIDEGLWKCKCSLRMKFKHLDDHDAGKSLYDTPGLIGQLVLYES